MLKITSTEFKRNFGKYLSIVGKEDIIITRNGIPVAQVSVPKDEKISLVSQITGIIPDNDYTMEDARRERLLKHEDNN